MIMEFTSKKRPTLITTQEFPNMVEWKKMHSDQYARVPKHGRMLSLFDPVVDLVELWRHFIEAKKQFLLKEVAPHWRLARLHLLYLYVLWGGLFHHRYVRYIKTQIKKKKFKTVIILSTFSAASSSILHSSSLSSLALSWHHHLIDCTCTCHVMFISTLHWLFMFCRSPGK
jgi:hypothetical protein